MFVGRIHPKWTSLPIRMQRKHLTFMTRSCWTLLRRGIGMLTTSSGRWLCATRSCQRSTRMVSVQVQDLKKRQTQCMQVIVIWRMRERNTEEQQWWRSISVRTIIMVMMIMIIWNWWKTGMMRDRLYFKTTCFFWETFSSIFLFEGTPDQGHPPTPPHFLRPIWEQPQLDF